MNKEEFSEPIMIYHYQYKTPIFTTINLYATERNLVGLTLPTQTYLTNDSIYTIHKVHENTALLETCNWLSVYLQGRSPSFLPPIAPIGNSFQKTVWQELLTIPYGTTTTYDTVAKKVAILLKKSRMSPQAIGRAVGHNPIPIIIPCHRVIGYQGRLVGYNGGVDAKLTLLHLEGITL